MRFGQERILSLIPPGLKKEIIRSIGGEGRLDDVSELRVALGHGSSVLLCGRTLRIDFCITRGQMDECFSRLIKGEMHIYGESIRRGYISPGEGVRVGIVGTARRDGGRVVGVDSVRALVFRFAYHNMEFGRELMRYIYQNDKLKSALIYSPPGGGKSTAVRSLALALSHRRFMRIAVIDERDEFVDEAYEGGGVDIIRGFGKAEGVELATRLLNPELIIIDEIGNREEALAIHSTLGAGVPVVATVHAGSLSELMRRPFIAELVTQGLFEQVLGIEKGSLKYSIVSQKTE